MTLHAFSARAFAVGAIGLVALAFGVAVDPARASTAYLDAWTFGTTVCFGALLLLMVGHAAKASWMVVTRRSTEAVVSALPLFLILFLPIAVALPRIYPWAGHDGPLDADVVRAIAHKHRYLNPQFFVARTVFYFAVAIAIGSLLRAWSQANDAQPRMARIHWMRTLGGGGLPVVALTLTWASFDWTMSLEPDWSSTIFGLYYFAGSFVAAIALACILLHVSRRHPDVGSRVTPEHAQAIGRVLFAMICFWAYQAFSQLLIYWIGDVPEEIQYYQRRTTGSWWAVTDLLVFGHFVVPFFVLIHRGFKRSTRNLAYAGAWMLFMHYVDVYWLVMPSHEAGGVRPHLLDLAALAFVGGTASAWVATRYARRAPLPVHDPDLAEGLGYEASI